VSSRSEFPRIPLEAAACRTPLGDARTTCAALLAGRGALRLEPVLGQAGGEPVPLALLPGRALAETAPPSGLACLDALAAEVPPAPWGDGRHPVFVTGSNFGVGSLEAHHRDGDPRHLEVCTPFALVELLRRRFGWGDNVAVLSHACVSAHLGLRLGGRLLAAGLADRALVFSFDFLSPFVTGGFHALKILNGLMPAPYADAPAGAIGLGDGAAFAVLGRPGSGFGLSAETLHNEMHHFTANQPDGAGFERCLEPVAAAARGRKVWLKGHGTGTLEAGRLEAAAFARRFPGSPLVSWKGGIGHTLGSCGLVELALALEAFRAGRAPGTVGGRSPCFGDQVALEAFPLGEFDGAVLASNAFGGAHAAFLLTHD
jgi:hypothetical protein